MRSAPAWTCSAAPWGLTTMIKAVLFSLDGTLLRGGERTLAAEYTRLAGAFLDDLWGTTHSAALLAEASRVLTLPRDAQTTNDSLLAETLAAAADRDPQAVSAALDAFWTACWSAPAGSAQPAAAASEAIALARDQGLAVVIAGNPLYPTAAARLRLAAAGLPSAARDYALVAGSDTMHFAKPDPAYYAEIVARIGVEPDEAIVVSDSLANDVRPAATARLRTYHVGSGARDLAVDDAGTLAGFARRIQDSGWRDALPPRALNPEAVAPQLWGNVGALFGLLASVQPGHWEQHPDPAEWSILQIVCHLLESEDQVQRPRLERILAADNPFLVNPPPPTGPHAPPCDSDGRQAANRFAARRRETLALLSALPAAAWNRPARHSVFGLTTLLEMALFTAQHDRLHLSQLCQTLGRCE